MCALFGLQDLDPLDMVQKGREHELGQGFGMDAAGIGHVDRGACQTQPPHRLADARTGGLNPPHLGRGHRDGDARRQVVRQIEQDRGAGHMAIPAGLPGRIQRESGHAAMIGDKAGRRQQIGFIDHLDPVARRLTDAGGQRGFEGRCDEQDVLGHGFQTFGSSKRAPISTSDAVTGEKVRLRAGQAGKGGVGGLAQGGKIRQPRGKPVAVVAQP